MKKNINTYFFIITGSIFLILTAPQLFSEGMVMDGVLYASVSRNLSIGLGTFWEPFLSHGLFPKFHEHPPLALGLQSLAFRLFGDSIYVERFYSLVIFSIIAFLITAVWKQLSKNKSLGWIPLLFYFIMLKIPWACANNMLENTMIVFLLAACVMFFKNINSNKVHYLIIGGIFIFLSALTKGLVGLYIWTLPFFYWLFTRHARFSKMLFNTLVLISFTLLPFLILMKKSSAAHDNLLIYFNKQIIGSVSSVKTVDHRYFILIAVAYHSIPIILTSILILVIAKIKNIRIELNKEQNKKAAAFIFLAASGIIPIMISLKQSGHYAITTYPFISIAFALFMEPSIKKITDKYTHKKVKPALITSLAIALFTIVFSLLQFGKYRYQQTELLECKTIITEIGTDQSIHLEPGLYTEWFLHGYFARYGNISLMPSHSPSFDFYLTKSNETTTKLMNYEEVALKTEIYKLYRLKSNP